MGGSFGNKLSADAREHRIGAEIGQIFSMLTTWFMPAPSLLSEPRMRSKVVRTSCSNVTLPLSGGNGTPHAETLLRATDCVAREKAVASHVPARRLSQPKPSLLRLVPQIFSF